MKSEEEEKEMELTENISDLVFWAQRGELLKAKFKKIGKDAWLKDQQNYWKSIETK
jgi:hypothetical protein